MSTDPMTIRFPPLRHEPCFVNLQVVDGKLVPAPWMSQGPYPTHYEITHTDGPNQVVVFDSREAAWG